jgi:hypothetical protein
MYNIVYNAQIRFAAAPFALSPPAAAAATLTARRAALVLRNEVSIVACTPRSPTPPRTRGGRRHKHNAISACAAVRHRRQRLHSRLLRTSTAMRE